MQQFTRKKREKQTHTHTEFIDEMAAKQQYDRNLQRIDDRKSRDRDGKSKHEISVLCI